MKNKKSFVIIPSALICLAALASCGNKAQGDSFVNGFESSKFESYLKVPANLSSVNPEYGEYARNQALANAVLAKSVVATRLMAGTDPFFQAGQYTGDRQNRMLNAYSPFSDSSRSEQIEMTVKSFDDEDSVAVVNEVSKATRKIGNTEAKMIDNNFEFISWIKKAEDEGKADIYSIKKGTSSFLGESKPQMSGVNDIIVPDNGIAYKVRVTPESVPIEQAKLAFNENVADTIKKASKLPIKSSGSKDRLVALDSVAIYMNKAKHYESDRAGSKLETYLSQGENTIYCRVSQVVNQGYVLSPNHIPEVLPTSQTDDEWAAAYKDILVPAYQITELTAKLVRSDGTWLCDYVVNGNKLYVTLDENLKPYSKPYCLCSSYVASDVGYDSLGKYGPVDDSKLAEYNPSGLGIQVGVFDDTDEHGYAKKDNYNFSSDDALIDKGLGGIYDYTMSARKADLIPSTDLDTYLFYGRFGFSSPFNFVNGDSSSDNVYFDLHALGEEEYDLDIFADQDVLEVNERAATIKQVSDHNVAHITSLPVTCEIIIILHKESDGTFKVTSCVVDYYSNQGGGYVA